MALTIKWTPQALDTFDLVINYLLENWTEKEAANFTREVNRVIAHISVTPFMFKASKKKNIHDAVIVPQCILVYRIRRKNIELLSFFDTRQNPKKKIKIRK